MSEAPDHTASIADWVEILNRQELGAVTATVQRLQSVLSNDRASLQDLSRALQQDPETTAKVLRVANSPAYLTGPEPVTSVARACSLMGLDTIRNISVTNRLLEVLLSEHDLPAKIRERLLTRVAASLHAAVLARQVLKGQDAVLREGIFIAAMLDGIGECAFWSSRLPESLALDARLQEPGCDPDEAIRRVIGGSFRELAQALVASWRLAATPDGVEGAGAGKQDTARTIRLCNDLAEALASEGWQSSIARRCISDIADALAIAPDEAGMRLNAWSKLAEELAGCYGVGVLGRRMVYRPFEEAMRRRAQSPGGPVRAVGTVSNPPRQARALREMSNAARDGKGAMGVIQALAEGVAEGIGLERVVVALLGADRKSLQMRISLGENQGTWGPQFRFGPAELQRGPLRECLTENRCVHVSAKTMSGPGSTVPNLLVRFATAQDFMVGPLVAGTRAIGVVYGDRAPSATPIETEDLEALSRMLDHLGSLLAALQRGNA